MDAMNCSETAMMAHTLIGIINPQILNVEHTSNSHR
jgi:hypothetical protein